MAAAGCSATSRHINGWCAISWLGRVPRRCFPITRRPRRPSIRPPSTRPTPPPNGSVSTAGKSGWTAKRWRLIGNSVGGSMAAVVSLMAKDNGGPPIKFQTLMWPVTDADFDTQSYKEFSDGYFLTRNMMIWFWDNYLKNPAQRREKYASPLRAAATDLQGLPPALVQTAHSDVLRDEGEAYARKLNQA